MSVPKIKNIEVLLNAIESDKKRADGLILHQLMKKISGKEPKIWGSQIIGYGTYHYKYESGREGDWYITGFSSRKNNFSIYIMAGFKEYIDLLKKLGKHKIGKSCLYINQLEDVDLDVLAELITKSYDYMCKTHEIID